MSEFAFSCPSCGATLEIENRFSKVVICVYCGQTSAISPAGLDPTGEKAILADSPSIFSIGSSGTMYLSSSGEQSFKVRGRLRYKYDGGFWDEWFLEFSSGKKLWLQEDEGEFTAFEKESLTSPVPPFEEISVGSMLSVNGLSIFVTEKNEALIAGGQGELLFSVKPGMSAKCVDGNAGGKLVSIEQTPDEICLSIGEEVDISTIRFDSGNQ
jgi:ribosomal protein S27E